MVFSRVKFLEKWSRQTLQPDFKAPYHLCASSLEDTRNLNVVSCASRLKPYLQVESSLNNSSLGVQRFKIASGVFDLESANFIN